MSLVAAGVAFYGFLALVPLMGATILSYGFIANPQDISRHVTSLSEILPREAASLIADQLINIEQTSGEKKGVGLLVALTLALFGARNGAASIITALNIAYEEEEQRGFIWANVLALLITVGAVAIGILAVIAIAGLGHLEICCLGCRVPRSSWVSSCPMSFSFLLVLAARRPFIGLRRRGTRQSGYG
jgi:membrane protein